MELIEVLKELIPHIKGTWFVGDGALLGLIREGKLIDYDNDIDLFILEDTKIDLNDRNNSTNLKKQKYYICDKVYDINNKQEQLNTWLEYCSHIKGLNRHLNRAQVFNFAAKDYDEKKIIPKFTNNHIDIFTLKKNENKTYTTTWDNIYYTEEDLQLKENYDLGFKVYIPNNAEDILERQYGESWKIPNPDFKYF
mgnify:FL=1